VTPGPGGEPSNRRNRSRESNFTDLRCASHIRSTASPTAGARGATLHLVDGYRPASAAERERARRRLPAGLNLDYDDDRLLEARDAARREGARLILSARPSRGRSARPPPGARLVRLAPCPVRLLDLTAADSLRPAPSALVDPAELPALG
jgi:hypothetical protein